MRKNYSSLLHSLHLFTLKPSKTAAIPNLKCPYCLHSGGNIDLLKIISSSHPHSKVQLEIIGCTRAVAFPEGMLFIGLKPVLKHKKYLYRILVSKLFCLYFYHQPHYVNQLTTRYKDLCQGTILHFFSWFSYNQ